MATVVVMGGRQPKPWAANILDCCSGGICACLYACYCPCCAAGDIAAASGGSYCCSCCVVPVLLPICVPCQWSSDRTALAARLNISNESCCCTCLGYMLCCHSCLLIQALAEIRRSGGADSGGYTVIAQPQQMVMQQQSYRQQQGYQQQQSYAPQQGGYAPQQGGYAPQQGGYAPQQGGYAPPQQGYAPQQDYVPQQDYAPQQKQPQFMESVAAPPKFMHTFPPPQ